MTGPEPGDVHAELASIVLNAQQLGSMMRRVADLAARSIDGADHVSVTLMRRGRAATVAFSGDGQLAVDLDERQYEMGHGPCMHAAATAEVIAIDDTSHDETYPDFAALARKRGIGHTLSVGLPTAQETSGALNLYGREAGPFSAAARDTASSFAGYASIALLNAALYTGAVEEVAQMREALVSRATIEQAKGVIMGRDHCTPDEAFETLKRLSSTSNRKLRDIAGEIVAGVADDS